MRHFAIILLLWSLSALASDQVENPTEKDYFGDVPIILSVSRLPQPLNETPGAVTVIDRDMIRLSGARSIPDLMRLVPGFQVTDSYESSAPQVVYHGGFGDFSNRIQVLIDGRSVYSAFFVGTAGNGLQTIALEDIERIEVLRGSNSAAFGARAFLGVINIITRAPLDTQGAYASISKGERGVRDSLLRLGWGDEAASYRLTASRRGDDGLSSIFGYDYFPRKPDILNGPYGINSVDLVNFRADLHPNALDTLEFRAGASDQRSGTGNRFSPGNIQRERGFAAQYLQADWRRVLNEDADLALSFSHTDESYSDNFPYQPIPPLVIDFGGSASNDALLVQHSFRSGTGLRIVWGGELRHEAVRSMPLFNQPLLITNFTRLFGNIEWRITPSLLLNAGAMDEHSSLTGSTLAPRLMLNWHAAPLHTLRVGFTRAYRPPSMFEKEANIRYVLNNKLLDESYVSRGNALPEIILSREIGYLGEIPTLHLSADARIFHEAVKGLIRPVQYMDTRVSPAKFPLDFVNTDNFVIRGFEYQLKFRPWQDTQILFNQSHISIGSEKPEVAMAAPKYASSLAVFQKLPGGIDFSLIQHVSSAMTWLRAGNVLAPTHRTDMRLAMPFRAGATLGVFAVVVQNMGSPYNDFSNAYFFWRRLFATLSLKL
ncbi:MAG: TonB-dependent receptor [Betaproteobacteria bacterium]|nr:TonB-dependent receptor [Betaproteobacteria bacterium]